MKDNLPKVFTTKYYKYIVIGLMRHNTEVVYIIKKIYKKTDRELSRYRVEIEETGRHTFDLDIERENEIPKKVINFIEVHYKEYMKEITSGAIILERRGI